MANKSHVYMLMLLWLLFLNLII